MVLFRSVRWRARQLMLVSLIFALFVGVLAGGMVVSNAWAIGHSIQQQPEPTTAAPPVAQRRWYARALFFAPNGASSSVGDYVDNAARE